jgi:hypothetical protein
MVRGLTRQQTMDALALLDKPSDTLGEIGKSVCSFDEAGQPTYPFEDTVSYFITYLYIVLTYSILASFDHALH